MKWNANRQINRLALPITRECNRSCPMCPAVRHHATPVSLAELRWAGGVLGKIRSIEVTGGEPSTHPEFEVFSTNLKEWFAVEDTLLLTNGAAIKKPEAVLCYDRVYCTLYTEEFARRYNGTPCNQKEHDELKVFCERNKKPFWSQKMDVHDELKLPLPWANRCKYRYDQGDMVSYFGGMIYGCCTSWQLEDRGRGIVLTPDWRDELSQIELPCNRCFLAIP